MTHSFVPVLIMLVIAILFGAAFLALNWFVGRHQRNPSKLAPYESGVPALDANRKRVNVRFYQIAMLFILFDIEAAFLYPWAVAIGGRSPDALGRGPGEGGVFWVVMAFLAVLLVGFVYTWRKGVFKWN